MSDNVWSDSAARTTLAQTQHKTSLDSVVQKVSTTHLQREDVQDWVCKACLPTGTGTTLIAYRVFEREGSCFAKRSWQEHPSHTDEDAMATETCCSKTLASCESGNKIKSCRHVDKRTWMIER